MSAHAAVKAKSQDVDPGWWGVVSAALSQTSFALPTISLHEQEHLILGELEGWRLMISFRTMNLIKYTVTHIAPIFIVTSPVTSYGDQIWSMNKNRSSAGFSLDIPLIMLVASILKWVARESRPHGLR